MGSYSTHEVRAITSEFSGTSDENASAVSWVTSQRLSQ